MKIVLGLFSAFVLSMWFFGPAIFNAMKKKDYGNMYHSMQSAKQRVGVYMHDNNRSYTSYSEKYARGLLGREDLPERKLSASEKRLERKKKRLMKKWRR